MNNKTLKQSLADAESERKKRNNLPKNIMEYPIQQYIMETYTRCSPNMYGSLFPKKIMRDLGEFLKGVPSSINRGDCHVNYLAFFEFKISYKSKDEESFSITNIRDWQEFDYFVLCFVDPEKNFRSRFYCVEKTVITDNSEIRLGGMNNTADINLENKHVGKRTSIIADDLEWILNKHNLLKTTKYTSLISFIKSKFKATQKIQLKK
jgi:hypothetical protein